MNDFGCVVLMFVVTIYVIQFCLVIANLLMGDYDEHGKTKRDFWLELSPFLIFIKLWKKYREIGSNKW